MSSASSSTLNTVAGVACFIDIYVPEGSVYSFQGGQILSCVTTKNIKEDVGSFEVELAPTLFGNNFSWAQILTPMSLVIIGMKRGSFAAIPMLGVITEVEENQDWATGVPVLRSITIRGADLAYYFLMDDYYSLWYLALSGGAALGNTSAGLLAGDPGTIGSTWYLSVMASGMFQNTFLPYKGAQVLFANAFGTRFDKYDVTVPYGDYFLGTNGAWNSKFKQIFPFPFYEFFVTTDVAAGNGAYGGNGGTAFSCAGLGANITATPKVVARINPVPSLQATTNGAGTPSFSAITTSGWAALPNADLQGAGFINSRVVFSEHDVHNFYALNPIYFLGQNGADNGNIRQFLFNYAVCIDRASVNRYGYRPMMGDTVWLSDPEGAAANSAGNQGNASLQQLIATLLGRLSGYYEPAPLMASAALTSWLRPDIQIGTRFTYAPFKDGVDWQFYVESVTQKYEFGGKSQTVLGLTRGLPLSVYQDSSSNGVLFNLHVGNAQRLNGAYQIGLPKNSAQYLQAVPPEAFNTLMGQIDSYFISPQAVAPQNQAP